MSINSKNLLFALKNKLNSLEILESTNVTQVEEKICDDIFKLIESLNEQDNCNISEGELYTSNFMDSDLDYESVFEIEAVDLFDNGKRGVNDPNYKGKRGCKYVSNLRGSNALVFKVTLEDVGSSYQDELQKLVQALFHLAKIKQPSILIFDEIETTFAKRGSRHAHTDAVVNQLLNEIDDLKINKKHVLIIGSTNNQTSIDDAFFKRFNAKIFIDHLDPDSRRDILIKLFENCINYKFKMIKTSLDRPLSSMHRNDRIYHISKPSFTDFLNIILRMIIFNKCTKTRIYRNHKED